MKQPHTLATIHADGQVTIEGVGFTGSACEKHSKPFRDALGGIGVGKRKPEYFEEAKAGQQEKAT
ncbi:MAG: DUF2997 domain-containing protein [Bdellovibrionales bacterium]|nr:DUF2997 domain-containing protein [Bdellovibrionales bacterium]